ncbi:hypothetical protein [Orenia marismortui]|uniref:hypothetical protein n=1 Tax=Orenia marismortui TaxID=46469 RepID=UPI0014170E94|nr:hypothetical protein [Orenia marismortui]
MFVLLISLAVLSGCSDDNNDLTEEISQGQALKVSINTTNNNQFKLEEFVVEAKKGEEEHFKYLSNGQKEVVFEDLDPGDWKIIVLAKDVNNYPRYLGENIGTISEGITSVDVELKLLDDSNTNNISTQGIFDNPTIDDTWVGSGYDKLTGTLKATALDIDRFEFETRNINQNYANYHKISNTREFYDKLDITQNASASLTFDSFGASMNLRKKVVEETKLSKNDVVVMYKVRNIRKLFLAEFPSLDENAKDQLINYGPRMFRETYGDEYIKSSTVGAEFYAIYKVSSTNLTENKRSELAIKAEGSIMGVFGGSASSVTSKFSSKEVKKYSITINIYSQGGTASFGVLDSPQAIRNELEKFNNNVANNKYLTVLDTEVGDYPEVSGHPYYDTLTFKLKMERWLDLEQEFMELHNTAEQLSKNSIKNQIEEHLITIRDQIEECSKASRNSYNPDMSYYQEIIDEFKEELEPAGPPENAKFKLNCIDSNITNNNRQISRNQFLSQGNFKYEVRNINNNVLLGTMLINRTIITNKNNSIDVNYFTFTFDAIPSNISSNIKENLKSGNWELFSDTNNVSIILKDSTLKQMKTYNYIVRTN